MKEIILPTELMAFFILNMFGHDSALHDFSTSSELGKGRVLNVLRSNTPSAPGTGSLGGGTWSGKGGGDEELNAATRRVYNSTVKPTLYACLQSTGFFDTIRNGSTRSDSFIIVDAKLAMGVEFSRTTSADNPKGTTNMGIAPGFIYLPERTYSPFEFEVNNRSRDIDSKGYARDMISYKHRNEPLVIQINRVGLSFNCIITRNNITRSYNLLSGARNLIPVVGKIIANNPDVSDAFMSNTVSTSITNYVDYIQLLLDGADPRYTFILKDYKKSACMSADETVNVERLIDGGKNFLEDTITGFWETFIGIESTTSMIANIPALLTKIDEIQRMFALIYKAILCAVGTAVKAGLYSCTQPPIAKRSDLNKYYLANKSKLEMFVYEYMASSINSGDNAANVKADCIALIKSINTGVRSAQQFSTFINFLQIVSDTLIANETDKKEIQEQKENTVVYVDNTTTKDNEDYIHVLTDLPIIAANPETFNPQGLSQLIELVKETIILLFDNKVPNLEDPDYTTILTDAVGSDNVKRVEDLLSQGAVNQVADAQTLIDAELLQTVFLGLINRLDSDQLKNLITKLECGEQSGGAKKKPGYVFVFSDAVDFFTQLTKQNRLTKMKAKFKELFDKTDVLPAFYTDLIIDPKDTSALAWKIDFNNVFLGFFENGANQPITDDNMIASINSGVIFPQIPSNVIDDLTLDNVLTQHVALIARGKITDLKTLGDSWLPTQSTPSDTFKSIIAIITGLDLPGIFVEPDEGSDIFWRFEQGYIYLLKCVIFYDVLVVKIPTGCETLTVNGFIIATDLSKTRATCPTPDDVQLNKFLRLFFLCTTRYLELLTKIDELLSTGSVLSGQQKICTGYALGSILTSVMTEMRPIISSFKNSALLNIETTEISRILAKKANASTILQSSTFGDNDTKLYNKFINWVDNNNFQRENNTVFSHNDNINGSLGTSLGQDTKWNKALLTDINAQYGGEGKFYINNAVNAPSALGKLGRGYFCPAASIMDNQSTCSTKTSAEANEGFEVGVMDFVIHDGRPFTQQQTGAPRRMIYRVRVVPIDDNSKCKIGAYLSIDGKYLINVADADIWTGGGSDWPKEDAPGQEGTHPPIIVPLNSTRGDNIPMDAKTCLKNIFATIDSAAFKAYNTSGFQSLIDALEKPDAKSLRLRRLILESSFVKGLGDFLQEASGFVENSGYEAAIPLTNPVPPFIQEPPNDGRLQLNNDRPSSVRAILLVLYGKGSINPNVIAGFLTEMKDKKKIPKSKYALAGRLTRGGGGGRNTKKTKASKRNKNTRRIKMKTRVNKRSKRQKRLKARKTRKVLHRVK